jgi:competence protein ComEC
MKKGIVFLTILLVVTLALLFFVRSELRRTGVVDKMQEDVARDLTLDIAFLDIGQGDATFITFPDGQQMLVDCAIDARVVEALGRVMPFYDRDIDYLVVTHPDLDHYGGCIDVMNRFDVGHILYSGLEKPYDDLWIAFNDTVEVHRQAGKQFTLVEEPMVWNIASTTVNILYPDHSIVDDAHVPGVTKEAGANDTSIVLKLSYGDTGVLMTADAEEDLERYLIATYGDQLDVEILKGGHHGSNTSSIVEFVSSTSPRDVIFSAGKSNKFGHPTPRVLKRFERAGAIAWRTDQHGDILVSMTTSSYSITSQF